MSDSWPYRVTEKDVMDFFKVDRLGDEVKEKFNTPARWSCIRKLYTEYFKKDHGYDPYLTDWISLFTPIEERAWSSIRWYGLPLYPQFPVGKYFVDFGDPHKKIAIELDGKQWHDEEKDRRRDKELADMGWFVFRISGSEACRRFKDSEDLRYVDESERDAEIEKWVTSTSDGVLAAVREVFYDSQESDNYRAFVNTLHAHRLLDYPWIPDRYDIYERA